MRYSDPSKCFWCDRKLFHKRRIHGAFKATKDHLYPKSRGGRAVVWSCGDCNQLKGDMHPALWDQLLAYFKSNNFDWRPLARKRGPRGYLFYLAAKDCGIFIEPKASEFFGK